MTVLNPAVVIAHARQSPWLREVGCMTHQWIIWIVRGLGNQQNRACWVILEPLVPHDIVFDFSARFALEDLRGSGYMFEVAVVEDSEAHVRVIATPRVQATWATWSERRTGLQVRSERMMATWHGRRGGQYKAHGERRDRPGVVAESGMVPTTSICGEAATGHPSRLEMKAP